MARKVKVSDEDEVFAEGYEAGVEAAQEASPEMEPVQDKKIEKHFAKDDTRDAKRWRHAKGRGLIHADRAFPSAEHETMFHPGQLQADHAEAFVDWDMGEEAKKAGEASTA
jgi:hypothetical protein